MFFVPLPHSNPPPQTQTSLELEGKQARTPHFHGGEEVQYDIYIYWYAFQIAYINIDKDFSHVDVYMS
jgi:hypothetical protein